jgi:hypothetical protein
VTSYSDIGEVRRAKLVDNDNIVLDPGTTTLIIRVYNNKPDSSIKYEDDNNILNEYEVKVELDK